MSLRRHLLPFRLPGYFLRLNPRRLGLFRLLQGFRLKCRSLGSPVLPKSFGKPNFGKAEPGMFRSIFWEGGCSVRL